MVGKFSDDRIMSGSRIPVLYCWEYGDGHPYATPNDELRRSICSKNGESEQVEIGEPGEVGNLLEPSLVESLHELLGVPMPQTSPPVMEYADNLFQASLDGLTVCDEPVIVHANEIIEIDGGEESITLTGPVPIECKVTSDFRRDEIPPYRGPIQLQAQMMAVGAEFGIMITLHRGIERHVKIYRADPLIQERIKALCHDFRERVLSEDFYKPVNVDDAAKVYQDASGDIEMPEKIDVVKRLEALREDAKIIESEIDKLQTELMNRMEDAESARVGDYLVKWPVRHYKAQPEKTTPAKEARSVRLKSLQIKRV
jgi:hypothetical protein